MESKIERLKNDFRITKRLYLDARRNRNIRQALAFLKCLERIDSLLLELEV